MICSFTLNFKPLEFGERIKKYDNYNSIKNILIGYGITKEELKKITVSNFITQDRVYDERNYFLRISSIDSQVTMKILRVFFLLKLENIPLAISNNSFILLNIHHNSKSAGQFHKVEESLSEEIKVRYITPTFFKIGSIFATSFEPKYVLKNIISKVKKSSLKDDEEFFLTREEIEKVDYRVIKEREFEIKGYNTKGITGEVVYFLKEGDNELLKKLNNLFNFATFSGVGYLTEYGYGQNIFERGE